MAADLLLTQSLTMGGILLVFVIGGILAYEVGIKKVGFNLIQRHIQARKMTMILEDLGRVKILTVPLLDGVIDLYGRRYNVNENWIKDNIILGEYFNKNFIQKRWIDVDTKDVQALLPKEEADADRSDPKALKYLLWLKDAQMQKELAETNLDFLVSQYTDIKEMVGQDVSELARVGLVMLIAAMMILFGLGMTYSFASQNLIAPSVGVTCNWQYDMSAQNTSNGIVTVVKPTGVVDGVISGLVKAAGVK